jgi:hypothetical protein
MSNNIVKQEERLVKVGIALQNKLALRRELEAARGLGEVFEEAFAVISEECEVAAHLFMDVYAEAQGS